MTETATERMLVLLNPASGNADSDEVRQALGRHVTDGRLETHEMAEGEDLGAVARDAVSKGFDMVVAAGGDGSVSAVANALVGSTARLGIIPLGTTNVLARELGIPLEIEEACALLAGPNATATIDAMRIGSTRYFTQVGVGVDALMIRDTTKENKKRFGSLAYLWTAAASLAGFEPRRFSIAVDDETLRPRASQIILANSGALGTSGLRWGADVRIDDGELDVCIVRARTVIDYLGVAWNVVFARHRLDWNLRYRKASRVVAIHADRPMPVQADGEVVGETPVEVFVEPGVLRVVVPPPDAVATP